MGIIQDFYDNALRVMSIAPQNLTGNTFGSSLDLVSFPGKILIIQLIGVVSGTLSTLDDQLKESSDNLSYSNISGAITTQVTSTDDFQILLFDRAQRYIEQFITIGGTLPNFRTASMLVGYDSIADFYNNTIKGMTLSPRLSTTTVNGLTHVDMTGGKGPCLGIQMVGAITGSSPTLDGKYQESDDESSWFNITGATFTQVTASNNLQLILFSRSKQYVRYVGTVGGSSPSFNLASMVFQSTVGGLNERKIRGLNRGLI